MRVKRSALTDERLRWKTLSWLDRRQDWYEVRAILVLPHVWRAFSWSHLHCSYRLYASSICKPRPIGSMTTFDCMPRVSFAECFFLRELIHLQCEIEFLLRTKYDTCALAVPIEIWQSLYSLDLPRSRICVPPPVKPGSVQKNISRARRLELFFNYCIIGLKIIAQTTSALAVHGTHLHGLRGYGWLKLYREWLDGRRAHRCFSKGPPVVRQRIHCCACKRLKRIVIHEIRRDPTITWMTTAIIGRQIPTVMTKAVDSARLCVHSDSVW